MTGIIVDGVKGSETAQAAAVAARDLALALGSTLHVVTASESDRTEVPGSGSERKIVSGAHEAEEVARSVADRLRKGSLQIEHFGVKGSPAHALVKQSETHRARMICGGKQANASAAACSRKRGQPRRPPRAVRCPHRQDR